MKLLLLLPYGIGNLILLYPVMKLLKDKQIPFDVVTYLKSVDYMMEKWDPFKNLYDQKFFIPKDTPGALKTILKIRKNAYDISVLSFPSAKPHYNLLQFLCGAKKRVGSKYPDDSFSSLSFLNSTNVPVTIGLHDTFQNLHLVNEAGFSFNDKEIEYFTRKISTSKRIGFHVGCKKSDSYKRWPLHYWDQLLQKIQKNSPEHELVLFFGPDETEELEHFEGVKNITIKKNLSLDQLYIEISQCPLFLSNDSGLMHIATLAGSQSISIIGPSDFRRTGPFSKEAIIVHTDHPCRPCSHSYHRKSHQFNCADKDIACMSDITPDRVFEEIKKFI
jgi:ADP-heptose:LPS heptosyltransferase